MCDLNLSAGMTGADFIKQLKLEPHPEGGYYRQTYKSAQYVTRAALPERFGGDRPISTAIFYLLQKGDFSSFHKIKSDECWHFYLGGTLYIHILKNNGEHLLEKLGTGIRNGEKLQYIVPAETWFAAEPAPGAAFTLTGCTVAPGFDFIDLDMGKKSYLLSVYPQHAEVIERLCR